MIDEMIEYVEKGQASEWLAKAEQRYARRRLRVMVISVLGWLKPLNRLRVKADISLEPRYPWCADLMDWLADDGRLSSMFRISVTGFGFRPEIDINLRKEICERVDQLYRPPLRTTRTRGR